MLGIYLESPLVGSVTSPCPSSFPASLSLLADRRVEIRQAVKSFLALISYLGA